MKEKLIDDNNQELLNVEESSKFIQTISSENSEQNKVKIKIQKKLNTKRDNSLFSEFNKYESVSSFDFNNKDREEKEDKESSNTIISRDCTLGADIVSMKLKNGIITFNPDMVLPPLLNKRTKFFKEIPYTEIFKLEKEEITKPLLIMDDEKDIVTAIQMFRNLLSYMNIRKSSKEPLLHAKKYLRLIRQASPILKDEAYLQVYKQLHNNHEYESFMAAYKMLAILSSCFIPDNKQIYLFILKYLYDEMKDNENIFLLNHIKYIFARMVKTEKQERKNIPCSEELEYIELMQPIPIVVYLFDGTKINLNIESYTSIKEVKEKTINHLFLDMQNSMNYCIYEVCTKSNGTEERFLDDNERVCDIIAVWKSEMDKDRKNKIESHFKFYFRILIFSPFEKDDTDTLEIVYNQNAYDVSAGRFPLKLANIITLVSLQLFIEYSEDDIKAKQSLEKYLDKYIPKKKMDQLSKNDWITTIINKYTEFKGRLTVTDAQWNYLKELKTTETYEMTQFEAKFNKKKSSVKEDNIPEKCIIGLKPDGLCILDEQLNKIVFYRYELIVNWGISKDQFIICMPMEDYSVKRICFSTSQTKVIQTVIEVYCNLKAGKSKKVIKEIIDGYDERFKSIDSSKIVKDLVHRHSKRGSNYTENDYKIMNDISSLDEIINDDEIFKDRSNQAKIKIKNINSRKKNNDNEKILLLQEQN